MDLRIFRADKVQVYVLFYRPTNTDPLLNRLVAFWDGPFCHCEMAFPERVGEEPWDRVVWGSSIYQQETVFFKPKTYKRDGYMSIALEVTTAQMYRIRAFCRMHADRGTAFNIRAMYAAYLPFQVIHTEETFCSKHVAEALQSAGLLDGLNPALMTPSRLYKRLSSASILQVIPSRMVQPLPAASRERRREQVLTALNI